MKATNFQSDLEQLRKRVVAGGRPRSVTTDIGTLPVEYHTDDEGFFFILVKFSFSTGNICAQIDGDTYGHLDGLRIYPNQELQPLVA